jgi:hypothetical protein
MHWMPFHVASLRFGGYFAQTHDSDEIGGRMHAVWSSPGGARAIAAAFRERGLTSPLANATSIFSPQGS